MAKFGRYAVAGFELAALIVVGFFVGQFLDRHFATHVLSWVGLLVGTVGGFRSLFRLAQLEARALEKEDAEQGPPPGIYDDPHDPHERNADERDANDDRGQS